ncbi:glycosyltransferase family 4 protein [Mucilaginibacter psychrotolerans]|uniref:Glycosyltransferase family 4 protein n=1 Tax=Mucilaginibacter psychrotolerans TaxID=1524096 RepID=A0A4Y8SRK7_9SPHI|nr:glycosyltransferase family 4 protein [Mucilaginibacter psychrotolerans]TFF40974.1 glycosyltransferase family 4 protein [Mucilaginibacter psychrotolerans]
MNILIVNDTPIPATTYGGTERVIWWLGKELVRQGHKVTYLVGAGSNCPFARVVVYDAAMDLNQQIPDDIDVVHFQFQVQGFTKKPYLCTVHNNSGRGAMDINSVFVSANHAARNGSTTYVYNGLDTADYRRPNLNNKRNYTHFLAKAAWRVKNVQGAIDVATKSGNKLVVMGGTRFNLKMGLRFTPNLNVRFKGMVNNDQKSEVMNGSKALLFPVLWNEPFGIAITESLYFGCPVFGTPYGSLPELVPKEVGLLSNSKTVLVEGLKNVDSYSRQLCHEYAVDNFNIAKMAADYLKLYELVLNGRTLNAVAPTLLAPNQPKYLAWND